MVSPLFRSADSGFMLLRGDCIELMSQFDFKFDMIFADPPYFLSNGGISVQSGKVVCVDKGEWDKSGGLYADREFNYRWLRLCRDKLKPNGTIWITGTYHNIFSVAQVLGELNYKILNCVTWVKTNPPPNISCRYFTHSTEFVLWARREKRVPHTFNYDLVKRMNGGKQMHDVWRLPTISRLEKSFGKHPTQKPLGLVSRAILASTAPSEWILDPFAGSCTTGIAATLMGRKFVGIEKEDDYLQLGINRFNELSDGEQRDRLLKMVEKHIYK